MMHLGVNLYILRLYPYHNERDITSNLDENRQASLEEELLNLIANQTALATALNDAEAAGMAKTRFLAADILLPSKPVDKASLKNAIAAACH
jgi:hypothetical protein